METVRPEKQPQPIWSLGFRPFFLLAALFAAAIIFIWAGTFTGLLRPVGIFDPVLWHAHEMIYGYATAVLAGFILTASQNWTGKRGVHGWRLQILVAIWIAGRVVMSVASHPSIAIAVVDLAFFPTLAVLIAPYFMPADMKMERVFFVFFAVFFTGDLLMHLDALGAAPGTGLRGALLGLEMMIVVITFIGGRVIPFFTESEMARAQPKSRRWVEILAHLSALLFVVTQFFVQQSKLAAGIAFFAAIVHGVRLLGWQVKRVRRVPILWVLHLAYLWIILGFALFGLVSLGDLAWGPAVHAFAIGGLGAMTYGMMSRISLGHTGRRIRAAVPVVVGYVLLNLAAAVRVLGPLVAAPKLGLWVQISGAFWIVAFLILSWIYTPFLIAPRADARVG